MIHTLFIYHQCHIIFAVDSVMNTVRPSVVRCPAVAFDCRSTSSLLFSLEHICHVQDCCVAELHTENALCTEPCNKTEV